MKNWKLIIGIVIPVGLIIVFMFFLSRDSEMGSAIKELNECKDIKQIKSTYDKHKDILTTINDKGEKEVDSNFLRFVRENLTSLNLSEKEIEWCKDWLPPAPTSLNLIIVPDLSKRIADTINNPDQIKNDITLLNYIWEGFKNRTRLNMNTKDRLIVDVTDAGQADGQFRSIANDLIFDLSEHKDKINRLYFTEEVCSRYTRNIEKLYVLGETNPIGADYWSYFRRNLSKHIQKSTLFDNYRNILIIITDGYLEAEHKLYTGDWKTRSIIANNIKQGNPMEETTLSAIKIPDIIEKFPTLEVLILEINERTKLSPQEPKDRGTTEDYDILKILWADWFKRLEIKNVNDNFFIQRNNATQLTKIEIDKFLNR